MGAVSTPADAAVRAPARPRETDRARGPRAAASGAVRGLVLFALVAALVALGLRMRDAQVLTPEHGLGYALGIVGGTTMLLLLMYPLRKRFRFLFGIGPVRHWFRLHMVLGIGGPLLILFHANFSLGSLNSNIALAAMLLVAGSGLVGRFLYTRIHTSLYGHRASLERLRLDSEDTRRRLAPLLAASPDSEARLQRYEALALAPTQGIVSSIARALRLAVRTRWEAFRLSRQLGGVMRELSGKRGWSARERRARKRRLRVHLLTHLSLTRRIAELALYERLFSWWHVLHLPLFVLLFVSAVAHIWAVHAY